MGQTILIVEDESAIADIIAFNLEREGYTTQIASDGQTGLDLARSLQPDCILLDVMLPVLDGFAVCKAVRQSSDVPILMLTAREEEADKVLGLDLGADDYITKPFSMRELLARIKANLRRQVSTPTTATPHTEYVAGNLRIAPEQGMLYKNGTPLELSAREYDIVVYLASRINQVVSREELMEKVWGYAYYGDLRVVDVAMRRLREKLEDDPAQPKYLLTKRGMGYYLATTT